MKGIQSACSFLTFWIDKQLIIEIKAVQSLVLEHEMQLVHYLTATRIDNGLLINFGPSGQVRRKFRDYKPKHSVTSAEVR
jgi:GxxExxY protein